VVSVGGNHEEHDEHKSGVDEDEAVGAGSAELDS
jgi:hypothetical protein